MRLLIQRVKRASVTINGKERREIGEGMCVFVGMTHGDTEAEADWLAEKLVGLRIFEDSEGKTNLSVKDVDGEVLIVSQFTLYASCAKGRRPSFSEAMESCEAEKLYDFFVDRVASMGVKGVKCGKFGSDMDVELVNSGPLTFLIEKLSPHTWG